MIYNMQEDFFTNMDHGPYIESIPSLHRIPQWKTVFDYPIMSALGISACPFVASAKGMKLASQLGFDVITWKTIRSKLSNPHPQPNLTYVKKSDDGVIATSDPTTTLSVSIGNASYTIDDTIATLETGLASLQQGQIAICSLYGVGQTQQEIIDDFVSLAQRVQEIGMHAVELNCSCPNVATGLYYKDIDFVKKLLRAVARAISIPITIKVGIHESRAQLQELLVAIAQAGGRGISGINSIGMQVLTQNGDPFFGENRRYAGVCGDMIRDRALSWVRDGAAINKNEQLNLTILGGGGIIQPQHFDLFFDAGADVGMVATGAILDPLIAINYHRMQNRMNAIMTRSEQHVI